MPRLNYGRGRFTNRLQGWNAGATMSNTGKLWGEVTREEDIACNVAIVLFGLAIMGFILFGMASIGNKEQQNIAQAKSENTQFAEGETAAEHGIPCEACPYIPNSMNSYYGIYREQWLKGWIQKTIELKGKK